MTSLRTAAACHRSIATDGLSDFPIIAGAPSMTRQEAIARCRVLQARYARYGDKGRIGHDWAAEWAMTLLDTRQPVSLYANWIAQQEARADRMDRQLLENRK